ncbi:hypothetical protein CTI12_AA014950 [Artemisia annua]|uniref:SGNH hydrolase-type esterase domain-containing protein n=1 Tax=Artemisia annua TaxID=35608 RepID=A0A2U1QLA7_ARTAN|nr:hypothetical protein CTI12_AA014950 [Artemisia annua]
MYSELSSLSRGSVHSRPSYCSRTLVSFVGGFLIRSKPKSILALQFRFRLFYSQLTSLEGYGDCASAYVAEIELPSAGVEIFFVIGLVPWMCLLAWGAFMDVDDGFRSVNVNVGRPLIRIPVTGASMRLSNGDDAMECCVSDTSLLGERVADFGLVSCTWLSADVEAGGSTSSIPVVNAAQAVAPDTHNSFQPLRASPPADCPSGSFISGVQPDPSIVRPDAVLANVHHEGDKHVCLQGRRLKVPVPKPIATETNSGPVQASPYPVKQTSFSGSEKMSDSARLAAIAKSVGKRPMAYLESVGSRRSEAIRHWQSRARARQPSLSFMLLDQQTIYYLNNNVYSCRRRLYANNGCYTSIISFGDSLADTGNLKQLAKISNREISVLLTPYGESFLNGSTGRCSNGRLIIDFLVLAARGILNPLTNASLEVQLEWFKRSLPSICGNASGRSLILVGEIGGNDYNYPILEGRPVDELNSLVPLIIDRIISVVNELIEIGAQTLVVPGNFPVGCLSGYLTVCGSEKEEYDPETGCLVRLNEFAEYHNELLQTRLNQIRELHPNVNVIYADYYNAAMKIYRSPDKFGFTNGALKACCGGAGPYNINLSAICGDESSTVCDQPDTYVCWYGIHLTEAAYKIIAKNLYHGPYTTPEFNALCPTSTFHLEAFKVPRSIWVLMMCSSNNLLNLCSVSSMYANGCYKSIISFGDSLADTGNLKQLAKFSSRVISFVLPPYGESLPDQSPGRCSNGLLIIDFLARGIVNPMTNASLEVQLEWFKRSLPSICGNASDCRNFIGHSLILMGEIGGNDFNFPMLEGKPIDELKSLVPFVINAIVSAINELIEMGAQTLVVPGNFPVGCLSTYLTVYASEVEEYDPTTGCLIRLNEFAEYQNELLQTKLNRIREFHPDVNVIYADYYNAAMKIYQSPDKFGFTNGALKACCGGGGPYNYNLSAECGLASTTVCDQPDTYEPVYRVLFKQMKARLHILSYQSKSLYANGCYTSIISFGDSLADTGNLKQLAKFSNQVISFLMPPYGESLPDKSTGRCSNGRLVIDFLAESIGLPLIPPYVNDKGSRNAVAYKQGVNYAVVGATALNSSVREARGIVNPLTNASLGVQLEWFKQSLPSICGNIAGVVVPS